MVIELKSAFQKKLLKIFFLYYLFTHQIIDGGGLWRRLANNSNFSSSGQDAIMADTQIRKALAEAFIITTNLLSWWNLCGFDHPVPIFVNYQLVSLDNNMKKATDKIKRKIFQRETLLIQKQLA